MEKSAESTVCYIATYFLLWLFAWLFMGLMMFFNPSIDPAVEATKIIIFYLIVDFLFKVLLPILRKRKCEPQ